MLKVRCGRYGISPAIWVETLVAQEYKCAACGVSLRKPHIDHDHETGKFRGLLCGRCNHGMHVVDNPVWLQQLLQYKIAN